MINVNTFKPGITFQQGKDIFVVMESQHSKQGRGSASVKAKVKNLRTGSITVKSFTGGEKVGPAHIDKSEYNYLYNDSSVAYFMNNETFEQIEIELKKIKWELKFLKEGQSVKVRSFENEILDIELPLNIELKVVEAPDAVKGNTANNPQKKVILETGVEVEAPMFIKENEIVIVSTETGKYVGRGK